MGIPLCFKHVKIQKIGTREEFIVFWHHQTPEGNHLGRNFNRMNFVWLDINASWSHSSLALPALHANLLPQTAAKCNMQVVRGTIKSPAAQIVQETAALQPTYIFATAWLFNINYLNEVLCRISALCRPEGIFLGGPEFMGCNRGFLQANRHITAVFKGEGEETFEPFISSLLAADGAWRNLPGFEYIQKGEYRQSNAVTVKDFPKINIPDNSSLFSWNKSFVQLETSRGCFNSCRFCVSGIEKCPIQNIPIEELRTRLKNIAARGIKQVRVLDRTFNGNPTRALQLLELFGEFASQLNFHLEVHPALLFPATEDSAGSRAQNAPVLCSNHENSAFQAQNTPVLCSNHENSAFQAQNAPVLCSNHENSAFQAQNAPVLCSNHENSAFQAQNEPNSCSEGSRDKYLGDSPVGKLRNALAAVPHGLLHIEAGIQTLRQDVLDNCSRKGSCAQAVKGLEFLISCGKFEVHADLIAGLPGYSYRQLLEDTMQLMNTGPAEIQLESLKLLPGTYFRIHSRKLGIRYSPAPPYEALRTPHINYGELGKAMVLSKILDLWYNDAKWREPFRKIFACNLPLMEKLIAELNGNEILTQPLSLENKGLLLYRFCKENAPQAATLISLQWIRNGLSMKKEPAENFTRWEMKEGTHTNPLYIENDPRYKYWHITIGNTRYWFSFNKEIERIAPCSHFEQEIPQQ